jgi:hypothetical protein
LLCGGAGAWAYSRFLEEPRPVQQPEAPRSKGEDEETKAAAARVSQQIGEFSRQLERLRSRVEDLPKPEPPPDLGPLEKKAVRVDELSQRLETIGKKLDPLPGNLARSERRIAELDAELDGLRNQMTALHDRLEGARNREGASSPAPGPAARPGPETALPTHEMGGPVGPILEPGVKLFHAGRYQEAYKTFKDLREARPEDARVWYLAALAHGLATGEWRGETERLVQQGAAREKAGTPQKPLIDSALDGLTRETGKEWLEFYRRRAR